jgi:hypothetical protein
MCSFIIECMVKPFRKKSHKFNQAHQIAAVKAADQLFFHEPVFNSNFVSLARVKHTREVISTRKGSKKVKKCLAMKFVSGL